LRSKKFVAFLISEISWKLVLVAVLWWGKDMILGGTFGLLMSIILIAGFVEVGYILGQAYLDRYLQVATLATGVAKDVVAKVVPTAKKVADKPEKEEPEG